MVYGALFVFGLTIGSFLNVLALRYQENRPLFGLFSIGGRSRCPHCAAQLRWFELIPLVSFLIQRGRCLHCQKKISLQYPVVEFASGLVLPLILFALSQNQPVVSLGDYLYLIALALASFALILMSAIDFRLMIIPDEIIIFLAGLGFFIGLLEDFWLNKLLAAGGAFLFFGGIYWLTGGRGMGFGDVKLAAALGFLAGAPRIFFLSASSFIIGAIAGVLLMIFRKRGMKDQIPFGPFLAAGFFMVILGGEWLNKTLADLLLLN